MSIPQARAPRLHSELLRNKKLRAPRLQPEVSYKEVRGKSLL
jgi:hypothetical protein